MTMTMTIILSGNNEAPGSEPGLFPTQRHNGLTMMVAEDDDDVDDDVDDYTW